MSIKSNLLAKLEKNKGSFISGQELADTLDVSRTAVWKAIKELKDEGYPIDAVPNKGYTLAMESSILSIEAISPYLDDGIDTEKIKILKSTDSTNNEAKRLIMDNTPYATVILAEKQTAGRGRRGRSFVSPPGDSIYVTFVLEPLLDADDSLLITVAASLAVVRTLEKISKLTGQAIEPQIKWVNDIFVEGKKVCGILTEAVSDLESGKIESLVLGIGININMDIKTFPGELQNLVGSVNIPPGIRNRFAAILINEVFGIQKEIQGNTFMDEYRSYSMIRGKPIFVIKDGEKTEAVAIDIDHRGGLLVEYENGKTETLNSGEISIRLGKRKD